MFGFILASLRGLAHTAVLAILLLIAPTGAQAVETVWYVDAAGCPVPGNGTSGAPFCSLQAAVDAAMSGDTIQVAAGLYLETVVIDKPLRVVGDGSAVTIIDAGSTGHVVTIHADSVELSGFTMQRSGQDCLARCAGVLVTAGSVGATISNCTMSDNPVGILLQGAVDCMISNCSMHSNDHGMLIDGSAGVLVADSTLVLNAAQAVHCDNSASCTFLRNSIRDAGVLAQSCTDTEFRDNTFVSAGLALALSGSQNRILDNTFTANATGVRVSGASAWNEISGNSFSTHAVAAVTLSHDSADNTVEGNDIFAGRAGIVLGGSRNLALANTVVDVAGDGISVGAQSQDCEVRDNALTRNDSAMHMHDTVGCTVTGNVLTGNGIWLEGDTVEAWASHVFSANTLNGRPVTYIAGSDDVTLSGDPAQVILAQCNRVSGNALNLRGGTIGLSIGYCSDVVIDEGTFADNDTGVRIQESARCSILTSAIVDNRLDGVVLVDADSAILDGNTIDRNARDGVCVERSADVLLTANTIRASDCHGLILQGTCERARILDNQISDSQCGVYTTGTMLEIRVEGNRIERNIDGLHLKNAFDGVVVANKINENDFYGMKLVDSDNTEVRDNEIADNRGYYAIRAGNGNNRFLDNFIVRNRHGMLLGGNDLTVSGNTFAGNEIYGIDIRSHSSGGSITGNKIVESGVYGILLSGSDTQIRDNTIVASGQCGIFGDGRNNQVVGNSFRANQIFGMWLQKGTTGNQIYRNDFMPRLDGGSRRYRPARDDGANRWYGATPAIGGNYWDEYTGDDLEDDGIGDTPYIIRGDSRNGTHRNLDIYPLMQPGSHQ